MLRLKPRTTYRDRNGEQVHIAGLAHRVVDGEPCYWSIQGDHYTEDGRFVHCCRVPGRSGSYINSLILEDFTLEQSVRNLVVEDDSEEAKRWWDGVVTERK